MAITFNKLKSPLLAPTDLISIGKFKGCRVCDVIEDSYEYLMWAEKQGFLKFTQEVIDSIKVVAHFENTKRHYSEEVEPYGEHKETEYQEINFEDVPF